MRNNHEGGRLADMLLISGNRFAVLKQALAADLVMDADMPQLLSLAPTAARDVRLPPEAPGLIYIIMNTSAGAYALTVTDDADSGTVGVIPQNAVGIFVCDGATWLALFDTNTQ